MAIKIDNLFSYKPNSKGVISLKARIGFQNQPIIPSKLISSNRIQHKTLNHQKDWRGLLIKLYHRRLKMIQHYKGEINILNQIKMDSLIDQINPVQILILRIVKLKSKLEIMLRLAQILFQNKLKQKIILKCKFNHRKLINSKLKIIIQDLKVLNKSTDILI